MNPDGWWWATTVGTLVGLPLVALYGWHRFLRWFDERERNREVWG